MQPRNTDPVLSAIHKVSRNVQLGYRTYIAGEGKHKCVTRLTEKCISKNNDKKSQPL